VIVRKGEEMAVLALGAEGAGQQPIPIMGYTRAVCFSVVSAGEASAKWLT
jgi:hypothetical protein